MLFVQVGCVCICVGQCYEGSCSVEEVGHYCCYVPVCEEFFCEVFFCEEDCCEACEPYCIYQEEVGDV